MVSFKRLGVSCGVQSIVFLGKLLEIASGHCYELRVAAAHRVFFSRVSAWNHFHDRCLVVPWQAPGREALCCPGCPEAEPGSNWSRAMQEADWRAAVFIPQQFLCVYSAVFLGFTRTYGRTWAPCLTLTLSNFPKCNFSWFFQCAWLTSWGLTSHHPRVSELKALLLPSPASRVSCQNLVSLRLN